MNLLKPFVSVLSFSYVLLGTIYPVCAQETTRLSVNAIGVQGNGSSTQPNISADGRFVVFNSYAKNLVPNDTNQVADVFVRDLQTGAITRVSVDSNGNQADRDSLTPSISADGRVVVFGSGATNLVAEDTNQFDDIFVHDRQTGVTTRVNVSSNGVQADSISFDANISSDGNFVVFISLAKTLVPGDTNGNFDVFRYDLKNKMITRVNVNSNGTQDKGFSGSPSVSADGRFVTFYSDATNLVGSDTNPSADIFVHDCQTKVTTLVSVSSNGTQANSNCVTPSISADGRFVAYKSYATNLVAEDTNGFGDIFLYDRQTKITSLISVSTGGTQGDQDSDALGISEDGRFIVFRSNSTNLVTSDTNNLYDVFVHDRQTGATKRIVAGDSQSEGDSSSRVISADGRFVTFRSNSPNLVNNDTNKVNDVFVGDFLPRALSISNPQSANEGSAAVPGSATFTVKLSPASSRTVTVNYATADGVTNGAKAGTDYVAKSGTLTFAPGETSKSVKVTFIGDAVAELNEPFFLDIKTPTNATIADNRGAVYIKNDDGPGIIINNAITVNEGNSGTTPQTFQVLLGTASNKTITVDWTTANNTAGPTDYTAASGTLTFAPGEMSKTITVLVKGDTTLEVNETYRVNLAHPTYAVLADSQGIGYIRNDDTSTLVFKNDAPSE